MSVFVDTSALFALLDADDQTKSGGDLNLATPRVPLMGKVSAHDAANSDCAFARFFRVAATPDY